jgi:hypothetical protein
MCMKSGETIDNLLLDYEVARDVGIDLSSF